MIVSPEYSEQAARSRPSELRFRALRAEVPAELGDWREAWISWPDREVMANPDYVQLFAQPCDRVVCVVGEEPAGAVLLPLILRPLGKERWAGPGERRWDATSPYGYGGPFARGTRSPFDAPFWRAYAQWCAAEGIVSTFVRLSLFPDQLAFTPEPVEGRGENVVIALEPGPEELWHGYDRKVRKWVRVAEDAGLEVELDYDGRRLDEFYAVYTHTMQRNGAAEWYCFSRSFFQALVDKLRGFYVFFHALHRGRVVSSDLVLLSKEHAYAFLAGTLADAFPLGPNYLLKHRALQWAAAAGKKAFVLGGGLKPNDGLMQFKRAFGPRGQVPFRVACLTHDEKEYHDLLRRRSAFEVERGGDWSPRPGFFPAYRA